MARKFLIVSLFYFVLVFSSVVSGVVNNPYDAPDGWYRMLDKDDNALYMAITAIVAAGVSPYDNHCHPYKNVSYAPILYPLHAPYFAFSATMMRLTGLSEVWVLCVLNPLLFALLAPFLVYVAGRVWGFDDDQRLFLLVTSLFVIDYSLLKITSIDGEMIGFYLSLVGCALFMTGRYLASVPFFCLGFASSVLNIFFPFILGVSFLVNLAAASPRRVDAGKILSLAIICGVFLLQVSPLFRKTSIIVDSQQSFEVTRIDKFVSSSPTYSQSQYFLPKLLPSLLVTTLYPVSYPIWSYLPKLAVPRVSGLVGYELTPEIMGDMHGFTLTAGAVFPAFIVLLFSFGFPVILLFAVLTSIHDGGKLVLIFCAYASMIVFSVLYMVTGFSLFPERVVPVIIGVFGIVLTLNYNEVKRRYGLIWNVLTVLALARAVVWTASVIVYGG